MRAERPDRRTFLTLGIGALAVAALPASLRGRLTLVRRRIPVMGTVAEVAIPSHDTSWAQRAIDVAFGELRRIEATMTRFRSDSDVGRLNVTAGRWLPVSDDTGRVLKRARRWAELSEGRFDPCLARVSELWDAAHVTEPPPREALAGLADAAMWRSLDVEADGTRSRARLDAPLAAVDLGGIAKGYGVDRAADALRAYGVFDGLINVGGDLVALGTDASGDPWRIGVRSPRSEDAIVAVLEATDRAVATSGDYLRFFEYRGHRYHHLLDPITGAPRETTMHSLTMGADRCVDADASATALFGASAAVTRATLARAPGDVAMLHHIQEGTS